MLKFYAHKFLRIITTLEYFCNYNHDFSMPEGEPVREILMNKAKKLQKDIIDLQLTVSEDKMIELIKHIKIMDKTDYYFKQGVLELFSRLDSELKSRTFLTIIPGKESYYNPDILIFGNEIANKLPNLIEDISEAGNCYALDRYTACVFHLMRAMEKSAQILAHKLDISSSYTYNEEWQTILNTMRGKIKSAYPKGTDANRIKYESIIAHLESVKIAWRNPTMHPKATYTEEEAKIIMNAVEVFIKNLVTIL